MSKQTSASSAELIANGSQNFIRQVTVFSQRAHVSRRVNASATIGLNRFAIEVTAFEVDADSVQARVFGEGEILAVQYQRIPVPQIVQADLKALDAQERQLRQQKDTLKAKLSSVQRQQTFLDAVANFSSVEVPKEIQTNMPTIGHLQDLLQYLDDNAQTLLEREQSLKADIENLDKELGAVQQHLKQLRVNQTKKNQPEKTVIEVLFQSRQAQPVEIEASYVAGRASWLPIYKADVSASHDISLTLFAQIKQNTGENWSNSILKVSNAMPVTTGALPEIQSWILHESMAYLSESLDLEKTALCASAIEAGAAPMQAAAAMQRAPEAHFAQASSTDKGTHFEYELPNPVDLSSGARESLLPLRRYSPPGKFFHYTIPSEEALVYWVCRLLPDAGLPSGRLNIHFDGEYIGKTLFTEKRPGEDLLLNLGVERHIKVLREQLANQKTETFFSKVERHTFTRELGFNLIVENLKAEAVTVLVLDAIPVSDTDRYQVKEVTLNPQPDERDWQDKKGVMAWRLKLEPNQEQRIQQTYLVKYPKDNPPEGID
ncbi:mucoidy inhibitor MuiA family protein [Candidatus Venteria ishoeyi]|uniref:DUF4139 domain-containing protein n=1 Tax=Candidatus Venteria ishoeyi TaxID=1899563 RepID=A0A1H6FE20_9GAMM|nr:mucoidy inhibitor MuiA family protein [Candidatus Venteria ishoeyi]SEH07264.1 Uncharacterised protein [Candidatus Venteria ishoeyi]